MKKKLMYRIELKDQYGLAKDLTLLAALSNGGKRYISLTELEMVAKSEMINYPSLNEGVTIHLIGTDLLIDKGTENILHIQEIEVMDLDMPQVSAQDARDILNDLSGVPIIDRYLNPQGLADNNNHECLN